MNFIEFEKKIDIDYIESSQCFGHHPMQLVKFDYNNKIEINALMHLNMEDVVRRVKRYLKDDFKEIHLSLDFSAMNEINNDFVLLLNFKKNNEVNSMIIQYDSENGQVLSKITNPKYEFVRKIINFFL